MGTGTGNKSDGKVATVADLLQRVAASCLSQRLPGGRTFDDEGWSSASGGEEGEGEGEEKRAREGEESIARAIAREKREELELEEEEDEEQGLRMWEEESTNQNQHHLNLNLEALLAQVFHSLSALKRSYRALQRAHSPWDPHRIHLADAALVSHLRNLDTLRHRFSARRNTHFNAAPLPLKDALAPYEAAIHDLQTQLKLKEAEAHHLRHQLRASQMPVSRARSHSARWATANAPPLALHLPGTPIPELFEACTLQVKSASKPFACHLLHLMRSARWDIPAAIHSLLPSSASLSASQSQYPKYAMESYVNTHLFHGFDHESFYMDGSLASLLDPAAFRTSCFSQFRDMRAMDPTAMLGVLPTCQFGRFAATKYLSIISDKMEESLFGHIEQRKQVVAGAHPRTDFYAEFLRAAKAVWMLHLLAFALDPAPTHFEVRKGAEFQPQFMESVLRFTSGRAPPGSIVGFAVAPGFRLGNGSVVRARVYLIPGNPGQQ